MKTNGPSRNTLHFNPISGASSSLSTKSSPPHERQKEELFPLQNLPIEIIDLTTKYLKIGDLFNLSSASKTFHDMIFHDLNIWKSRTNFSFRNRTELYAFLDLLFRVGKSANRSFSIRNLYHLNDFNISLDCIPRFAHLLPIKVTDLLRNSPKETWESFLQQAKGKRAKDTQKNIIAELKQDDSATSPITCLKDAIYLSLDASAPLDLFRQENCTSLKCIDLFGDTLLSNRGELLNRVATLQSLEHLSIRATNVEFLPGEIGNLSSLVTFNLWGKALTALPTQIGNLSSLVTLDLGRNRLTALPPEIGKLSSLQTLFLIRNRLTAIPREIGNLSSLKSLGLGRNRLTALPPEIGKLSSLKSLGLGGNRLTALPPEIGNFSSLVILDVGGNRLTALPLEIGNFSSLEILDLGGNRLTALLPEIGNLSSLETLNLRENELTALPPEIGKLSSLETLDLARNRLTTLPLEMVNLSSLQTINLDDNQLTLGSLGVRLYAFLITALRIAKRFEGTIMQAMP